MRLWAFGYDMDNMKARCWYDATLPLYSLADCDRDTRLQLQAEIGRWLDAATLAGGYLRGAVKDAWFSSDARGEFSHVDASFRGATEPAFYRQLQALIDTTRDGHEHADLPSREAWHRVLASTALRLFERAFVGAGPIERQNPRRIAQAHKQLLGGLYGVKLKQALGLPTDSPAKRTARKRAGATITPQEPA